MTPPFLSYQNLKGVAAENSNLAKQSAAASRTLHRYLACQRRVKSAPLFSLSTSPCRTSFISPGHVAAPRVARDHGEIWQSRTCIPTHSRSTQRLVTSTAKLTHILCRLQARFWLCFPFLCLLFECGCCTGKHRNSVTELRCSSNWIDHVLFCSVLFVVIRPWRELNHRPG